MPEQDGAAVCAWSHGGGEALLTAPLAGGASWRRATSRLVYRAPAGSSGIARVTLTPGAAGRSKIAVVGKGAGLGLPLGPLATPVVVQLQSNDRCWESTFTTSTRNDTGLFQGKSD